MKKEILSYTGNTEIYKCYLCGKETESYWCSKCSFKSKESWLNKLIKRI